MKTAPRSAFTRAKLAPRLSPPGLIPAAQCRALSKSFRVVSRRAAYQISRRFRRTSAFPRRKRDLRHPDPNKNARLLRTGRFSLLFAVASLKVLPGSRLCRWFRRLGRFHLGLQLRLLFGCQHFVQLGHPTVVQFLLLPL